jgi:hypothetical protein
VPRRDRGWHDHCAGSFALCWAVSGMSITSGMLLSVAGWSGRMFAHCGGSTDLTENLAHVTNIWPTLYVQVDAAAAVRAGVAPHAGQPTAARGGGRHPRCH